MLRTRVPSRSRRPGTFDVKGRPDRKRLSTAPDDLRELVGESQGWLRVKELTRTLAAYPGVDVLLLGETGTGKDTVALALHRATGASRAPFVPINCASLPEALLENELFGHERGAFTGANDRKPGLFELANGGTLFLDEIGDLALALQPKLLRALESRSFTRLGGVRSVRIHCRLVCASSGSLRERIASGALREDLFQRLSTFNIELPPLRERPEDIPLLIARFLDQAAEKLQKRVSGVAPGVLDILARYSWPGNVRELRKVVERAVVLSEPGTPIETTALPPEVLGELASVDAALVPLREVERRYIEHVLARCGGNRRKAARLLQISPTTLRARLGTLPAVES